MTTLDLLFSGNTLENTFLTNNIYFSLKQPYYGEVRERPNRRDWKSRVPATVPWVRTPPSPPYYW